MKDITTTNQWIAFKRTVGTFAIIFITLTVLTYLAFLIPVDVLIYGTIFALVAYGFWILYNANLDRIRFEEKYGNKNDSP